MKKIILPKKIDDAFIGQERGRNTIGRIIRVS